MKVYRSEGAGFCFGVRRAIDLAFKVAGKYKGGVYTLGPLIHNPQVIEKLVETGVKPVDDLRGLAGKDVKAVIVRTHGITQQTMRKLIERQYEIIDATCPYVKKAQHYAKLLKEKGYQVLILGDSEHPEVKGLLSYAGRGAVCVKGSDDLPALKGKVGIVVQTTMTIGALKELVATTIENTKELDVYNTICSSTVVRLKETGDLAGKVDVMVIVGGRNSANTSQLAAHCRSLGVPTHHIETATELKQSWFSDATKAGISAGASTPDWLIDDVEKSIKALRRTRA